MISELGWSGVPAGLHLRWLNKVPAGSQRDQKAVVTAGDKQVCHAAWNAVTFIGRLDEFGQQKALNTRWFC